MMSLWQCCCCCSGYDVFSEESVINPSTLQQAVRLEWNLSSETIRDIENAKVKVDRSVCREEICINYKTIRSIRNLDMSMLIFDEYGKGLPKSVKLSPDGYVQSAIQLAYYKWINHLFNGYTLSLSHTHTHRLYARTTAVYESGSIRWFKYGRTDTIRSCTNASHAFVKAMTDHTATVSACMHTFHSLPL